MNKINKMRTDVPVFARCCFCLPLRYGLITWGYVRLAISLLFFVEMCSSLYSMLYFDQREYGAERIITSILLILAVTDIVLNVIFIVGGHKKNLQLLRAYYIYSIVLCVLFGLIGTAFCIQTLVVFSSRWSQGFDPYLICIIISEVAIWFAQICVQIYVVLLVRSEITKLRNNCEFRFQNIATNAECIMECPVEINAEEGTEKVPE